MTRWRIPNLVLVAVLSALTALALPLAAPRPALGATPGLTLSIRLQVMTLPHVPIYTLFTVHPQGARRFVPVDAVIVVRDERPTPRQGPASRPLLLPRMGNTFIVALGCQNPCLSATGGAFARPADITMHPVSETRAPLPHGRATPFDPGGCVVPAYLSAQPVIGAGGSPTVLGPATYTLRVHLHVFLHGVRPASGLVGTVTLRPLVVVRALTAPLVCGGIGGKVE